MRCLACVFCCMLLVLPDLASSFNDDVVKSWARTLGEELWKLSESLTKSDEIRIKYKQMNASVKQKDGKQILDSSLRSVSTMLTRKINAVKCIHATAKRLAKEFDFSEADVQNFTYCSAKYSTFTNENNVNLSVADPPKFVTANLHHYDHMNVESDSHFYDIDVNTGTSCVHVPTNIFFKEKEALTAILWSEGLSEIFTMNYQSDPSLVWQYFGSSHGILRFYPAMRWNTQSTDTYDCRVKSWYIEAATCSKDVIILFDVSGSMTGFKNYVARRTLSSLLATLSNNDYVNVYVFSKVTEEVVKCFTDLVQATRENLKTIEDTLEPIPSEDGKTFKHRYPLDGYANLTIAYTRAFSELKKHIHFDGYANLTIAYTRAFSELKKRRTHCNVNSPQGCNQLVMVITDYVPGNLSEVFEEHNREVVDGEVYIPVRVFTYLIGKEVTNVREIQDMACSNRGYFVHIHSVEEVQQQVLKYINVIARPMILEGETAPPPTWTHANIDDTRTKKWAVSKTDMEKPDEDKLVTSVAIPAFDQYQEGDPDAILLGVAGTDVPIDSIAKLAQPHQLGVNGYSFIVSNNGYVLLHPLLITTINGDLQDNYNSIDFVEVEQVDDGKGPRELGDKIKKLRQSLVFGTDGKMLGVEVLFHYDNMRRISRVKHDYYFNKLVGTPFSMGISLPQGYGDTELLLKDNPLEAKQGKDLTGINVTDYFRFSYRLHPDWVYCKYHYLEGHESENAEIEIWKFLVKISENELNITKKQYEDEGSNQSSFNVETDCTNKKLLDKDDYYCNEDLVKQLIFDGKLSSIYFKEWNPAEGEKQLAEKYNVSVRFIAAASGLTRWHYIFDDDKNEKVLEDGTVTREYKGRVFGDIYHNAIEETWYKAAVLQHMIDKESLVIATPLPILDEIINDPPPVIDHDSDDITVTASFAIFYKDGNSETPASVVGFQYSYKSFKERFLEITSQNDEGTSVSCVSGAYDCYVVDGSGYIVLANNTEDVGTFFGVKQSHVLQSLMDKHIFEHVEVFNYQALCPLAALKSTPGSAWKLLTPFDFISNLIRWIMIEAAILMSDIFNLYKYVIGAAIADEDYYDIIGKALTEAPTTTPPNSAPDEDQAPKPEEKPKPFSCDHRISLYILNHTHFTMGMTPKVFEDEPGDCHPPYWASYITKTNLLLVVVERGDWGFLPTCEKPPDTKPTPTENSTSSLEPCHKLDLAGLPRRRLEGCFTYDEKERNITACGKGCFLRSNEITLIAAILFVTLKNNLS